MGSVKAEAGPEFEKEKILKKVGPVGPVGPLTWMTLDEDCGDRETEDLEADGYERS